MGHYWEQFKKSLGLKTIDDRIKEIHSEASNFEQEFLQNFFHQRDAFSHELLHLEKDDKTYQVGYYLNHKGEAQIVEIPERDFQMHKYVIGTTGMGKTYFIENLIRQHIFKGNGVGVIDVHGDLYGKLCDWVALVAYTKGNEHYEEFLRTKVVLFDITDHQRVLSLNPLEPVPAITSDRQANQLIKIFKRFHKANWGVKIEEILRFVFMALIEINKTFLDIENFLTNETYRNSLLPRIHSYEVRNYFEHQYQADQHYAGSVLNKLRPLLLDRKIKAIIGHPESSINLADIINKEKIFLINLNKSHLASIGDMMAALIMGLLHNAVLSRVVIQKQFRRSFYLYVDEFQNFANEQFEEILTESRKYMLHMTMAHQSLAQLSSELQHVGLGNTDQRYCFKVDAGEASTLARGMFEPSGSMIKESLNPYDQEGETEFFSENEEIARYRDQMSTMPPRTLFYQHRLKPYRARELYTMDVPDPAELLKIDPSEFAQWREHCLLVAKEGYTQNYQNVLHDVQERYYQASRRGKGEEQPADRKFNSRKKRQKTPERKDIIPDIGNFKE